MKLTKEVIRELPWTKRTTWTWPAEDQKLLGVFDQVADVDVVMEFVEKPGLRVCIQAGGAAGIWALRFSQFFKQVYAFEPHPLNFACLEANLDIHQERYADEIPGAIVPIKGALGQRPGFCRIESPKWEQKNYGAFCVYEDSSITDSPDPGQQQAEGRETGLTARLYALDDFDFARVGLIYLDIEGMELPALRGAEKLIARDLPVVAVEDKGLSSRLGYGYAQGDIEKWLAKTYGYTVVARPHRDVIMAPADATGKPLWKR